MAARHRGRRPLRPHPRRPEGALHLPGPRRRRPGGAGPGWPASLAGFPLGQWIADNRRTYARGDMDADRVDQL
ncbi:helicase associated domain-containing protein, partial [Streptomyces geysiriensis]|uniref:helicase associated domain-containing protein n=1 Tax=Streptomyces geysiriensis TaxID=68207 RepID=UPI00403FD240